MKKPIRKAGSDTITPPAGYALVEAHSSHYATINGGSDSYNITLL